VPPIVADRISSPRSPAPARPRQSRPVVDRVGRSPARQLARGLVALTAQRRAIVVLADLTTGTELDRHVAGPAPGPLDGDALLALVLPTEPTVCQASRLHEPSLRLLAQRWRADRLLIAPCTFGHTLVALAVVALAHDADSHVVVRAARPLCERFAVAVIGTRLFANAARCGGSDSSSFSADV
jgi:hypothetical protein